MLGGNIIKLFAFSYAFGSSYCYNDLKKYLDKNIEFIQFDYPGHGSRILESLLYNVSDIVDDTYKHIKSKIKPNERYALLGYSMGGLICYELLKRLENEHNPNCVFIFASHHPDYRYKSDNYEQYDLKDVKSLLKEYGGTPADALDSEELLEYMKPLVCADMISLREYSDNNHDFKIKCPMIVAGGIDEIYTEENKVEWKKYAMNEYEFFEFEGGHFFLFNNHKNLKKAAEIINGKLAFYC